MQSYYEVRIIQDANNGESFFIRTNLRKEENILKGMFKLGLIANNQLVRVLKMDEYTRRLFDDVIFELKN